MIRRETLPPISDYGLIGNRHSCALIERSGTIDWCCLPHLDDASVFGALLDLRRGGHWRVGPAGRASTSRAYLGIAGAPRPLPSHARERWGAEACLEVVDVVAGSPADAGGVL